MSSCLFNDDEFGSFGEVCWVDEGAAGDDVHPPAALADEGGGGVIDKP